jgi:hypothetical protein
MRLAARLDAGDRHRPVHPGCRSRSLGWRCLHGCLLLDAAAGRGTAWFLGGRSLNEEAASFPRRPLLCVMRVGCWAAYEGDHHQRSARRVRIR